MTMRRALAGIGAAALLGLGGCTGLTAEPAAEPIPPRPTTTAPEPAPTPTPTPTPPEPVPSDAWDEEPGEAPDAAFAEVEPVEAECVDRENLAFGFSNVDAATGDRYLTVTVINCTPRPVTIPPTVPLTATDAEGHSVPIAWEQRPAVGGHIIESEETRFLHLRWKTSGRCERGATSLDVEIDRSQATRSDCFQLGGFEEVEVETALAHWSTDPWNPL